MESAIIIGVFVVYAAFSLFMVVKAFCYGVKVGRTKEAVPEPFERKKSAKPPKMSKEQERYVAILENIERFDGSSLGQKEIPNGRTD